MENGSPDPTSNASTHETAAPGLSNDLTTTPAGKKRRIARVVLGTIILGAVGSGLWDLLMKPGVSQFGRLFLGIITFGSKTLRDSAYSSAALDPTSLPALVILWLMAGTGTFIILITSVSRIAKAFSRKPKSIATPPAKKRRKPVFIVVAIILDVVFASYIIISVSILNQGVLIHRVFSANLNICAPYLSFIEQQQFRARFASVKTREDYLRIDNDLKAIAAKNSVILSDIQLW